MTRAKRRGPGAIHWRLMPDHSVEPCSGDVWVAQFVERQQAVDMDGPDPWRVAYDELGGPCYVSTVFTGINTAVWKESGPFVFETMARIGPRGADEITRKTTNWADALAAHAGLIDEHNELIKNES